MKEHFISPKPQIPITGMTGNILGQHYIRSAIKEFSDINAKQKFDMIERTCCLLTTHTGMIFLIYRAISINRSREPMNLQYTFLLNMIETI